MSTFRAAALQMVSTDKVQENLETASCLLEEAAKKRCNLAILPENFTFIGQNERDRFDPTGPSEERIQHYLAQQARQHQLYLVAGSIALKTPTGDRTRTACLLYDPQGDCLARYDKIHLFDVLVDAATDERYHESATIEPGDEIVVAKTPLGNIGLSVCYDLRFPELYRSMLEQAVQIITVAAAFTAKTGAVHWETLLKSRAIENLCYVIAANQGGRHTNRRNTWGHSMIIDPWGTILDQVTQGEGLAIADLDLTKQLTLRSTFPALQHRRPGTWYTS